MANANILFNKRIRIGHTSTLTDSSWPNLNIDRLELVKPQHWPSRVGQPQHWPTRVSQTSTLTDSSRSNLNIDRLELVKPQHWPTRVGQTSTSTDASWSNLLLPPPYNHVPLEPSLLVIHLMWGIWRWLRQRKILHGSGESLCWWITHEDFGKFFTGFRGRGP